MHGQKQRIIATILVILIILSGLLWIIFSKSLLATTPNPRTSISVSTLIKKRLDAYGISQVFVPAGCFVMGSDPSMDNLARDDEQPQHTVCITHDFWMDQYEVTNEDYQKFVEDNGYLKAKYWSLDGWNWLQKNKITGPKMYAANFSQPRQTRIGINWYEANAYAQWRGGQLPSEAEFEYAARGLHSFIFPWGNTWDSSMMSEDNGKSWIGASDLACNALEWVSDWYDPDYYKISPKDDPTGPLTGDVHVLRGGEWDGTPGCTRSATRKGGYPYDRGDYRGIRVIVPVLEF